MRIEAISLSNFRGFTSEEVTFDPRLTVLVGRNGSGKTSVLDAIVKAQKHELTPSDVRVGARANESAVVLLKTDVGQTRVRADVQAPAGNLLQVPRLFLLFYRVGRSTFDRTPGSTPGEVWSPDRASANWWDAASKYDELFYWFREMEDLENERIRHQEGGAFPQLESVRQALASLFPGYLSLRVHRQLLPISAKPVLTLEKEGRVLPFDVFSEGERSAIAMVADIARRLALLDTNGANTAQRLAREGVVMIDELEQHLHPKWQRWFIKQLPKTFPGLQFIVTTQSPIVVSEVAQENLRVLSGFKLVDIHHHRGRDANSVLEETFETSSRPEEIEKQLDSLADRLDDRDLEQAGKLLDDLTATLGETDGDIVYYRNILERLRPAQ